jgi:hypothetical protein
MFIFFENLGLLIEAWKATEVWTVGKVTMCLVAYTWMIGVIFFISYYLGKKILKK